MNPRLSALAGTLALIAASAATAACGAPPTSSSDAGPEPFIAVQGDFACYRTWDAFDGGSMAFDGLGVNDEQRTIYINKPPSQCDTSFPVGTIIVKDTAAAQTFAMVKRGAGFNPEVGDWEWFELTTSATTPPSACTPLINWRGAAPPNGMYGATLNCNSCHVSSNANDYVAGSSLSPCQH